MSIKKQEKVGIKKVEILKFMSRMLWTKENSIDNLMIYNNVDRRNKTEIFIFFTRQFTLKLSQNIKKSKNEFKLFN